MPMNSAFFSQPLGVIWDLDGVLVDSAAVHYKAWLKALDEDAHLFPREKFRASFGTTNRVASSRIGPNRSKALRKGMRPLHAFFRLMRIC